MKNTADIQLGTSGYDNDLTELWNTTAEYESGTAYWSFDSFDNFMCRYLV